MNLVLALLLVAAPAVASPAPLWRWPVDGPRVVVEPYLQPLTPYGSGHRGIDIDVPSNETLYAPADGVIHFSGQVGLRWVFSIEHAGEVLSSYDHAFSELPKGTPVKKGDSIGHILPGHCASDLCVHIGVRVGGEYVNPLLYFGGVPRSVLLPTSFALESTTDRRDGGRRLRNAKARNGLRRHHARGCASA